MSPSAPAPVLVAKEEKKPSLLKRLLNVLTGKPVDAVDEAEKDKKPEDKPKREQNKRPVRNNRNDNNRRPPRRRPDHNKSDKEGAQEGNTATAKQESQPKEDSQNRNANANANANARRTSRRGGRRQQRPRNEDVIVAENAGNKIVPEKKEVDGNSVPKAVADVDGNGSAPSQTSVVEVDGNKPTATENKPRKPKSSGPRRRRAPAKDKQESVVTPPTNDGVVKESPAGDNSANKEKVVPIKKRAPRKIKPKEDASKE